jgi:Helix-turn-helix domain
VSIKVMAEVWESSSAKGGARLVLLALADHANDEGYCHPSVARLARKSALTERNVQLILRNLEARGELVTLRNAGRGNVNAYWVLPPATVTRLTLEGKNAKNFHPLQTLEEKMKSATEKVKTDAQKVKAATEKVKPTSPRTVKNHQEPSRTTTRLEVQTRKQTLLGPKSTTRKPSKVHQPSSAARTTLGTTNGFAKGSARDAWNSWLTANAPPDWLEPEPWARWLGDLDEREIRVTSGRLEEHLKRLHDLQASGESQAAIVARAIAGGWSNLYPPRASPESSKAKPSTSSTNDRYGRYR